MDRIGAALRTLLELEAKHGGGRRSIPQETPSRRRAGDAGESPQPADSATPPHEPGTTDHATVTAAAERSADAQPGVAVAAHRGSIHDPLAHLADAGSDGAQHEAEHGGVDDGRSVQPQASL